MGKSYSQLALSERIKIEVLRQDGLSMRAIAARLGRSPATISRELGRNSKPTRQWRRGSYQGERAHGLTQRRRRWDPRFKLARQPDLRTLVRDRLAMGWSPEQIAGRLERDQGRTVISAKSIYRYVYHRSAQKDYWHRLLPRAKHRRGRLGRRGGSRVHTIRERIPLTERPAEAADRATAGHWEADMMLFSTSGQAVLVAHERHSRLTLITRQPNKAALPVVQGLKGLLGHVPKPLCQTITFDNGGEFFHHFELTTALANPGLRTFFCDPHAPWQKGGIENAIGRLRRSLPRKTDLATMSADQFSQMADTYNHTPRKCLAFLTPNEVFSNSIKTVALQP